MDEPAELTEAIETEKQKSEQSEEIKRLTEEYEKRKGKVKTSPSNRASRLSEIDPEIIAKMRIESETNLKRKAINFQKRRL